MFTHSSSKAHTRPFTNPRTAFFLPLLAYVLLAGLALGPVETARAQTDVEPNMPKIVEEAPMPGTNVFGITSAPWRAHFGEHAALVLREAEPEAKQAALRDLIAVASYSNGTIDLSETLTSLVEVFEQGISTDHSLMALQALDLIGTEHSSESRYREAMREVYQIAQEKSSDEVRRAAASVLKEYSEEER